MQLALTGAWDLVWQSAMKQGIRAMGHRNCIQIGARDQSIDMSSILLGGCSTVAAACSDSASTTNARECR